MIIEILDLECVLFIFGIKRLNCRKCSASSIVQPFLITYRLELSIEDMYVCGHFLGGLVVKKLKKVCSILNQVCDIVTRHIEN